jgi:hypothetical protein
MEHNGTHKIDRKIDIHGPNGKYNKLNTDCGPIKETAGPCTSTGSELNSRREGRLQGWDRDGRRAHM